jgi:hydrogenase maturation protein HypF
MQMNTGGQASSSRNISRVARRWLMGGRVQGVGYRAFVFNLAQRLELSGMVQNLTGRVLVEAQGKPAALDAFAAALVSAAPPLARPRVISCQNIQVRELSGFEILPSTVASQPDIHIPPDNFLCDDCRREMLDPNDRRYRYPFINCTQCGPRYTLIMRMPYDRPNTTMAGFPLCSACRAEYEDPRNRRFHAQPLACPVCGPQLDFVVPHHRADEHVGGDAALLACVAALRRGETVAVKGIGGYHLMCDALDPAAIARLRASKHRPHKPLAVMFPWQGEDGLQRVRAELQLDALTQAVLCDASRPIVLIQRRADSTLPDVIAPGLREIGAMLPYSPLHHLLLDSFWSPLVATSGNVSGEPVLTGNAEAETRLGKVAQAFLHHNRTIARPADDSVIRVIANQPRLLRAGRGIAPLEFDLPFSLPQPLLAVGGHMKNAIALAWNDRAVLSPHIGDLGAPRSLETFEQVIADLQQLYGVKAQAIACDAHPGYASSRWAAKQGLPLYRVQHHHAHASALAFEANLNRSNFNSKVKQGGDERVTQAVHTARQGASEEANTVSLKNRNWLVFTWDGVGLGEDGTLWGGEALHGKPGAWQHVASFKPFRLPGGERAGREPWRSAAALCWESGLDWQSGARDAVLLKSAWQQGLNAPVTTAAGRLFDAASSLLGLADTVSFEGQGPMLLEAVAADDAGLGVAAAIDLPLHENEAGLLVADWTPLLHALRCNRVPVAQRAMQFHLSLAHSIVAQTQHIHRRMPFDAVGLTGGVFQNKLLAELAMQQLGAAGFEVYLPQQAPCNDGGLALGQLIEAASKNIIEVSIFDDSDASFGMR